MKVARFPLSGSIMNRNSSTTIGRDQYFQNCYSFGNADELTGGKRVRLVKRDGFTTQSAETGVLTRADLGSVFWSGAATPACVFSFSNGTSTIKFFKEGAVQVGGNVTNVSSCLHLTETKVSTTPNLVAILTDSASGLKEAWYYPESGAWTQITDTDFPPNQTPAIAIIGPPAHMDGYMFQMTTTGQIWNSDLNSVSAWSANNFISAQSIPDAGMGLARQKDYIVAFGTSSIEIFRNAGNPSGSPLSVVPNSTIRIGARSSQIRTIGDSIYFLGITSDNTQRGAYRMTNLQAQKISTPDIDPFLNDNGCVGSFKTPDGYEHVLFSSAAGQLLCFCTTNNRWWFLTSTRGTIRGAMGYDLDTSRSYISLGDGSYGTADAEIGLIDGGASEFRDGSETMTAAIQLSALDFGTNNRKFWKYVRLSGDKQTSATTVTVSYSDDDAVNFTTAGTIDMSVSPPAQLTRLGASRRRVWKFTNATNTPLSLEQVEIGYEVGPT